MTQVEAEEIEITVIPGPTPALPAQDANISPAIQVPKDPQGSIHESPKRSGIRFFTILISLYLVLFIGALDQTVLATSIPVIASELDAAIGYAWIGSAYLLASAATGPVWAKVSDIWGRKKALLGAVAGFGLGSLIAALSSSSRLLIAARALQGVAAGGLAPLVSIVFADLFSVRNRALYLGIREVVWALAGLVGPLLGGALSQYASWRWNFWINLPICVLAFVLLLVFLDVHEPRTPFIDGIKAFDWCGAILIVGVALMVLLGLDFGGTYFAWSSVTVICLILFGCLALGVFLYVEKSAARYPLVPLRVFRGRSPSAAFTVGFLNGMVYIALPYYLPFYLQSAKGASPFQSGLLILPLIIPGTTIGFLSRIFIHRTGRYVELMWLGTGLVLLSIGLYTTLSPTTPLAVVGILEALGGISLAMLFQAPVLVIQNAVSQQDTASAIAAYGFLRNFSTAVSLVLGGVVFQNGMDNRLEDLRSAGVGQSLLDAFSGGKAAANVNLIQGIADSKQQLAVEWAFSGALRDMWIMYACIAGVGFLASGFVKHVDLRKDHRETRTGIRRSGNEGDEDKA